MLTDNTANKLREMHLSVMASTFKEQLTELVQSILSKIAKQSNSI